MLWAIDQSFHWVVPAVFQARVLRTWLCNASHPYVHSKGAIPTLFLAHSLRDELQVGGNTHLTRTWDVPQIQCGVVVWLAGPDGSFESLRRLKP